MHIFSQSQKLPKPSSSPNRIPTVFSRNAQSQSQYTLPPSSAQEPGYPEDRYKEDRVANSTPETLPKNQTYSER